MHDVEIRGPGWFARNGWLEKHVVTLAARHPGFRREAFWRSWAFRRRDAAFVVALASAAAGLRWPPALLGVVPYLWLGRPSIRDRKFLQRCVEIINNPRVPKGVNENAAIALGRLGLDNYDLLAPHLPQFAEEFLISMDEVDPSEEKATAFKGFSLTVAQNPQAIEGVLLHFFVAIARYRDLKLRTPVKSELHDVFQNVSDT